MSGPGSDRKVSKLLALVLRHDPGRIGVTVDPAGWVEVPALLAALRRHGHRISRADLERVVAENDKQRFSLDPTCDRIRANQGHSVPVDLALEPQRPPERLFHGTARRNLDSILSTGLHRAGRHAVHLSADVPTAIRVGARHSGRSQPVVLAVQAGQMHRDGHRFTRSVNGVWLVEAVPGRYLSELA